MSGKAGIVLGVGFTILAFFIGLFGVAVLIGVGESANNTIAAFAAVSFPFALLAGFFSFIVLRATWAVAVAMFAPVLLVSLVGAGSSGYLLLGAIWTVMLTCAGAYLGSRLRSSLSGTRPKTPS